MNGVELTEDEFLDYYIDVNATLPAENEEYFVDVRNGNNFRCYSRLGVSLNLTITSRLRD